MIFADKLILLRKKSGMTQEELADKMDVTRQAIAKWEGMQSIPELSKIIKLSQLFGVSTDYLLKDEIEEIDGQKIEEDIKSKRYISLEDANKYIKSRKVASKRISLGVMFCILSPIMLIVFGVLAEYQSVSEGIAVLVGMATLLILVAISVVLFVKSYNDNAEYEYILKEDIELDYGANSLVKELKTKFKPTYDKLNIVGIILCILAILPIFIGVVISEDNDLLIVFMVCIMLSIISIGVYLFCRVGIVWASFISLLEEGEYSKENKKERNSVTSAISTAFWLLTTAVYLTISFLTKNWGITWIVWAVAGCLYSAILVIIKAFMNKSKK